MKFNENNTAAKRQGGFTLVEVVVVLGVILLLAGIAVPLVNGYIQDSQRARARSEVKMLGASVMSMYKDLNVVAARNSAGTDNRLRVLGTGKTVPTSNPFLNNSGWSSWFMSGTYGDTFDNQMIKNTPQGTSSAAYATTGEFRWRGPYLADSAPLDPWSRPYLIMMRSFFDKNATYWKKVIILSAGPDGRVNTSSACTAATDVLGDDIGFVLSQR